MWTNPSGNKFCATCNNWAGPRQLKLNTSVVDSPSTYGKCYAGHISSANGMAASMGSSCCDYCKWAALK